MRLRKRLRKLWCYFRYYIYSPYWHWIYFPVFKKYRKYIRRPFRRWKRRVIDAFWRFVAAAEKSPEVIGSAVSGFYKRTKRWLLSFTIISIAVKWVKAFLKVYFKIVNFRRLLFAYIAADFFYYHWTSEGIDKDLRIWNICMLAIFFKVLYMLMDGADGKLRLYSHDFITRFYLKRFLKTQPAPILSEEQMADPFISKYIRFRHKRNAYIAIFGFFYTGQPLFRVYI